MKPSFFPLVLTLALAGLPSAHAATSIAQVTGSGSINLIDTATGVSTAIYTSSSNFNGLAYNSNTSLLYMVDSATSVNSFVTFDPANPSLGVTTVSTLRAANGNAVPSVLGATFNPASGQYVGISEATNILRIWNPSGGNAVSESTLNLTGTGNPPWSVLRLGDIVIDNDGALLISSVNGGISQAAILRYESLAAAQAGDAPTVFVRTQNVSELMNGIAYDGASDTLYGYQNGSGGRFVTLDQTDGTIASIINTTDPAFDQGGDLSEAFPTPVPEPTAAFLSALAGLGLLGRRRRA